MLSDVQIIGVILAIASGVLIGSSFVLKKKGLIRSQEKSGGELGEGVAYLKSVSATTGLVMAWPSSMISRYYGGEE